MFLQWGGCGCMGYNTVPVIGRLSVQIPGYMLIFKVMVHDDYQNASLHPPGPQVDGPKQSWLSQLYPSQLDWCRTLELCSVTSHLCSATSNIVISKCMIGLQSIDQILHRKAQISWEQGWLHPIDAQLCTAAQLLLQSLWRLPFGRRRFPFGFA